MKDKMSYKIFILVIIVVLQLWLFIVQVVTGDMWLAIPSVILALVSAIFLN